MFKEGTLGGKCSALCPWLAGGTESMSESGVVKGGNCSTAVKEKHRLGIIWGVSLGVSAVLPQNYRPAPLLLSGKANLVFPRQTCLLFPASF